MLATGLQRFGSTIICVERLLVVKQAPSGGNAIGYGLLVFDNGQEVAIPAVDAKALVEACPDKALKAA